MKWNIPAINEFEFDQLTCDNIRLLKAIKKKIKKKILVFISIPIKNK